MHLVTHVPHCGLMASGDNSLQGAGKWFGTFGGVILAICSSFMLFCDIIDEKVGCIAIILYFCLPLFGCFRGESPWKRQDH